MKSMREWYGRSDPRAGWWLKRWSRTFKFAAIGTALLAVISWRGYGEAAEEDRCSASAELKGGRIVSFVATDAGSAVGEGAMNTIQRELTEKHSKECAGVVLVNFNRGSTPTSRPYSIQTAGGMRVALISLGSSPTVEQYLEAKRSARKLADLFVLVYEGKADDSRLSTLAASIRRKDGKGPDAILATEAQYLNPRTFRSTSVLPAGGTRKVTRIDAFYRSPDTVLAE